MGQESQAWYVKASFGAEWGPMSINTFLEMADRGSLARDDLARCGASADWEPISAVLDQLRSSPVPTDDCESIAETPPIAEVSHARLANDDSTFDRALPMSAPPASSKGGGGGGALPGWSNYWTSESPDSRPLIAARRSEIDHRDPLVKVAASAAMADTGIEAERDASSVAASESAATTSGILDGADFAVLNDWKRERKERLDRLLKIVSDREAAAREAAAKAQAEHSEPLEIAGSTADDDSQQEALASPQAMIALKKVVLRPESWEHTLNRWQRSLPSGGVVVLLLFVPLAVWWLWPSSDASIAETYRLMYDELLELRERPNDKTGMEEFVERSQAQLDAVLPGLVKRASPNQPDVQWLLWMGRDCLRPMLKNPRQAETKPEVNFQKLLAEWQRRRSPEPESLNDAASIVKESVPDAPVLKTSKPRETKTPRQSLPADDCS